MDEKYSICRMCNSKFIPDKYHPNQTVCPAKACQHKRQLENQKKWRKKNPQYFKYKDQKTSWEKKRYEYLKAWREAHKDYFKKYHQKQKGMVSGPILESQLKGNA